AAPTAGDCGRPDPRYAPGMTRSDLPWRNRSFAWALSAAITIACQADPAPPEQLVDEPRAITYWQDVAPIYFEHCVGCHREGGIGPFVLDDYPSAAGWASTSATAVENRVMPPWLVTDD